MIGQFRDRVTFARENATVDGGGGHTQVWATLVTVWGHVQPQRGREVVTAGRVEGQVPIVLRVRSSTETNGIATGDRATIDQVDYDIKSVTNPDRRGRFLEMLMVRGGAV